MIYYTSGGSNSNSGTLLSPWATLSYACLHVTTPGDIIHILPGTTVETVQCYLSPGVSIEGEGVSSKVYIHWSSSSGGGEMTDSFLIVQNSTSTAHISGVYFSGVNICDKGISVNNHSNVSIYNCTIIDFVWQGIRFDNGTLDYGNSVHDCILTNSGGVGPGDRHACLSVLHNTGFRCYNNIFNTNLRPDGENGLGFKAFWGVSDLKIYNNTFNCPPVCDGNNNYPFALEFWDNTLTGYGTEIYGNTIIGQLDLGSGTTKGTYSYSYYIHNNTFGDSTIYDASKWICGLQCEQNCSDVIISSNHFLNNTMPIYLCSWLTNITFNNIYIYDNIFENVVYGNTTHGVGIQIGGSVTPHVTSNIYIWNNTFIAYSSRPAYVAILIPTADTSSNIYIQNNIIKGFVTAPYTANYINSGGTLSNLVLQKNVLYNNGNSNALLHINFTPTSLTDDGGIIGDPLLTSDFHLSSTSSPAYHAGMHIATVVNDYAGLPFNVSTPSVGAYEFGSSTIPVTSVTVTGEGSATTITINGGTLQMYAAVLPTNATDQTVTWSVVNGTGTATISSTGLLTALTNGDVTVKATANG